MFLEKSKGENFSETIHFENLFQVTACCIPLTTPCIMYVHAVDLQTFVERLAPITSGVLTR